MLGPVAAHPRGVAPFASPIGDAPNPVLDEAPFQLAFTSLTCMIGSIFV